MPPFNLVWFDTSSLPYAPWRAFAMLTTGTPAVFSQGADTGGPTPQTTFLIDVDETIWYFDAVFRIEHTAQRRITEHPVQTGANISDHSFQLPARVSLEIGMSDVMSGVHLTAVDSFQEGDWGDQDKSVKAFQKIIEWQKSGAPMSIGTRLLHYDNMVIENVHAPDDFKTKHGLKCIVSFRQIITSEVIMGRVSVREQLTNEFNRGALPTGSANQSLIKVATSALGPK